jgi:hypothetical protein
MPRFVILEHDHPELHWDFMLEANAVLRTWKLSAPPQVGQAVSAESSFDHRLVYLEYEGAISGDRGSVVQWDAGTFEWDKEEKNDIRIELSGKRCSGPVEMVCGSDQKWQLTLKPSP